MATNTGATWVLSALAALGGSAVAIIVVLNLHIVVGLEQGYAATPREVLDHSLFLAGLDVVLLVGGPLLAVAALARSRGAGRD